MQSPVGKYQNLQIPHESLDSLTPLDVYHVKKKEVQKLRALI
jgi:hypothetical protein